MEDGIKCDGCVLVSVVSKFIEEIERCLECEVDLGEIAEELRNMNRTLSVIFSKWNPQIIYCLYFKSLSFNELKRILNVSSRVLSDKLKILEEYGIVDRIVKPEKPPKVYYRLTDSGRKIALSLIPALVVIKLDQ